ncbi:MAG: hypothetical protein IKE42_14995 [Aquamicrobium sp.]|nr:hypothetical protein [Aquamicrobium sp.]
MLTLTTDQKQKLVGAAFAATFVGYVGYLTFEPKNPDQEYLRDRCTTFLSKGTAWADVPGDEQMRIVEVCGMDWRGGSFVIPAN